jgi:hypothetical protein
LKGKDMPFLGLKLEPDEEIHLTNEKDKSEIVIKKAQGSSKSLVIEAPQHIKIRRSKKQ